MAGGQDWDIKISLDGTEHKLRLLRSDGRKHWVVQEIPPQPRVEEEASARLGENPLQNLPFEMDNWTWGAGLDRFGLNRNEPGHIFRYADGFGIDTAEGIVRHGPEVKTIGAALTGTPLQVLLFKDKVYLLTKQKLYSVDVGTTSHTEHIDNSGSYNFLNMEVFGSNLYLSQDNNRYTKWDGSSATHLADTSDDQSEAAFFLSLQGEDNPLMVKVINTNQIDTSTDPSSTSGWATSGQTKIGDGDAITNLFMLSGLLFVATQSGIFVVDSEGKAIELNKLLRNRRSSAAFSMKAESGNDVWLSDGIGIFRIVAEGFEIFDMRDDGPFLNLDSRPFSEESTRGTVTGLGRDLDAVFVAVTRGSDTYIYRGVETIRGIFSWSPLIKLVGDVIAPGAMAVAKVEAAANPVLYFIDADGQARFATIKTWTTFNATWEMITSRFTATLETWDKLWDELTAYQDRPGSSTAKITVHYRVDGATAWTEFNGAGALTADGINNIKLTTPIAGKRIQLRFVGTVGSTSAFAVHLRSFNLEGRLIPDHRRTFDFRVVADTATESAFLYSIRTDVDSYVLLTDRFGVQYKTFVIPGFPVEEELYDEVLQEPVRVYHLIMKEVG